MRHLNRLAAPVLIAAMCAMYLGPIAEGDLFWHLSEGRGYAGGEHLPIGSFPTQWLGQMALYYTYELGGYEGIVYLRAGVYALLLSGLYLWMRREGLGVYHSLLYLLFPALMLRLIPNERPQLFTYLMLPLTVFMLERHRRGGPGWWLPGVACLLCVWGQLHAGVALGVGAVAAYAIGEGLSVVMRRQQDREPLKRLAAMVLAPVAIIMTVRPDLLTGLVGMVRSVLFPGQYAKSIQEFLSPLEAARGMGLYFPTYWTFLAVAGLTILVGLRRIPAAHVLVILGMGLLSLNSIRFIPLFLIMAPLVAVHARWVPQDLDRSRAMPVTVLLLAAAILVFNPNPVEPGLGGDFPRDAMKAVRNMLKDKRIFNYQAWSGYLAWEVQGKELFLTVENVSAERNEVYEAVMWAAPGARLVEKPQWEALLEAYGVEIVVIPAVSPVSGVFFPLVDRLALSRSWVLIYADDVALIFARDIARNSYAISVYGQPPANAMEAAVGQAHRLLAGSPANKELWRSLGDAYTRLGRAEEARAAYEKAR